MLFSDAEINRYKFGVAPSQDAIVATEGLGWHHNPGGPYCWEEFNRNLSIKKS